MARDIIGHNWGVSGDTFSIFERHGFVNRGRIVLVDLFGKRLAEIPFEPIERRIDDLIGRNGNDGWTAYVGISPLYGLMLVLGGHVTVDMLCASGGGIDRIDLPRAEEFFGCHRISILRNPVHSMATYDGGGRVKST